MAETWAETMREAFDAAEQAGREDLCAYLLEELYALMRWPIEDFPERWPDPPHVPPRG